MFTIRTCNSFITIFRNNINCRGLITTTTTSHTNTLVRSSINLPRTKHRIVSGQTNNKLYIREISSSPYRITPVKPSTAAATKADGDGVIQECPCPTDEKKDEVQKLGIVARFKKMYKEYWYVLLPVHIATSAVWYGSFFYASKSGVDIVGIMESYNVSAKLLDPLRDSSMGHLAVAYILYKIATPVRYTVTLGGTTISIKYLVKWGYIKPVPSRSELVKMYHKKKVDLQEIVKDTKLELAERKQSLSDGKRILNDKAEKKLNGK